MTTSIFIKTCAKDMEWLVYCLKSIHKFGSGFIETVIVADYSQRGTIPEDITNVHYAHDWTNGYMQQQSVKLMADKYAKGDTILFVDSDCVFYKNFTPADFMRDGKPILLKTHYDEMSGSGAEVWKDITEGHVGFPVEWEYMRRVPCAYRKDTLPRFQDTLPDIQKNIRHSPDRNFSEFNALGAYIEKFEPENYFISDTMVWMQPCVAKQFWSWGGVTPEVMADINKMMEGKWERTP